MKGAIPPSLNIYINISRQAHGTALRMIIIVPRHLPLDSAYSTIRSGGEMCA